MKRARRPRWEVYQDTGGLYRWRLWSANNRIIAESGEGYTKESGCKTAIERVTSATALIKAKHLADRLRVQRAPYADEVE